MEHRCDHRKLLPLEIVIDDRNLGRIRGRTRNISLGGMLVDIGEIPLQLNSVIDISFPVICGGSSRECRARAMVVHQHAGSLGLMFSELDSDVRQMLRKLLYGYATLSERAHLSQVERHPAQGNRRAVA